MYHKKRSETVFNKQRKASDIKEQDWQLYKKALRWVTVKTFRRLKDTAIIVTKLSIFKHKVKSWNLCKEVQQLSEDQTCNTY